LVFELARHSAVDVERRGGCNGECHGEGEFAPRRPPEDAASLPLLPAASAAGEDGDRRPEQCDVDRRLRDGCAALRKPLRVVALDDVYAARERIDGRLHRTPLLRSATLSKQTGGDVRFKAELFQRTGSFKPRGVLNRLATLTDNEKARGVISISAGNHAQALAYASAVEGIDALVVMWQTASPLKIAAARGYGATVDDSPPDMPAAFEHLDRLVAETGRTLVHPYDDPVVMAGQGTVGLEMIEDVPDADIVLVQGGGGGLGSGIATAVKGMKPDARVYVVAHVRCSCGNEFYTRSTKPELHVEVCSNCHPFYTGKQKLMDTGGRVERFQRRLEKAGAAQRGS